MKELLAKINDAAARKESQTKCEFIAQVYERMKTQLEKVEKDLDRANLTVDVTALDTALGDLESLCSELVKIINPELQRVLFFLKPRFEAHMYRHMNITWEKVKQRLYEAHPKKIWSLNEMERTGGEPDVVGINEKTGELIFEDRSPESPIGRRNCLYDQTAEDFLRAAYYSSESWSGNAIDQVSAMGAELLDEDQYREAQEVDQLDQQTWIWLKTPLDKRTKNIVLRGYRDESGVKVCDSDIIYHDQTVGFRARLMV